MANGYAKYTGLSGGGGSGGVPIYSTLSAFPVTAPTGSLGVAADTGDVYEFNGASWQMVAGPGVMTSIGTIDTGTPSADGAQDLNNALVLQSASVTVPGLVNLTAQTFAGQKTLTNPISLADGSNMLQTWTGPGSSGYQTWQWENNGSALFLRNSGLTYFTMEMDNAGTTSFNGFVQDVAAVEINGTTSKKGLLVTNAATTPGDLANFNSNGGSTLAKIDNLGNITATSFIGPLTGHASLDVAVSSLGNLTDAGTDGIVVTGGGNSVVGSVSLAQHVADTTHNGYLASTDWNTFNGKQAAGSYITSLTGGVTASGPGAASATVVTNANLTGPITSVGNATSLASSTGSGAIVLATSPTLITPALGTPTALVLTSATGLPLATGVTGNLPLANIATIASNTILGNNSGSTGVPIAMTVAQINTLLGSLSNPMTTLGDIIYENATPAPARLAGNTTSAINFLAQIGTGSISAAPVWTGFTAPTVQSFTVNPTGATNYSFTVTSANATVGATYTNNGKTFTVLSTIASGTLLFCSGTGTPAASGTLTKASGTGDATITFSAFGGAYVLPSSPRAPLNLKVTIVGGGASGGSTINLFTPSGGGGGGGGGASVKYISSPSNFYAYSVGAGGAAPAVANGGNNGGTTTFGTSYLSATGGTGGVVGSSSVTTVAGSAGGTASGGDLNVTGGGSGCGVAGVSGTINGPSGSGGSSFLGGGGQGSSGGAGATGGTYGGGGGGAAGQNNTGGAGASGLVLIEEYYQ